jgi:hypothetical protein
MMRVMLDCSPTKIADYSDRYDFDFWQLRTPLTQYAISGRPWALDNGCFSGSLPNGWRGMLDEAEANRPVFVALPDIVGSARRTMDLFEVFEHETAGLPRALVLQDGINDVSIPWQKIDAVFVGGTDRFKTSDEALAAVRCAKLLGKWVHVGRVNTPPRAQFFLGLADSIDGSGISRYDHMLEGVLATIRDEHPQLKVVF